MSGHLRDCPVWLDRKCTCAERMAEAEQTKATSLKMIQHLPDDPREAVTVCALNFAHVAVSTGCDDDTAIKAVRAALKQMRRGSWWLDA